MVGLVTIGLVRYNARVSSSRRLSGRRGSPGAKRRRGAIREAPINPVTAFEDLRHDLGDVEALTAAAAAALAELPYVRDVRSRRKVERLVSLVGAAARTATSALDEADVTLGRFVR